MDWDRATPLLAAKLDRAHIKPPAPGKYGDYLEGWHVINEANRIFGFGGWSYTIDHITETWRGEVELTDRAGKPYTQARASYACIVTVRVGDVVRQDVGHGHGQGKPAAWGDVIESAAKEAATDALKRALRTFGNPFGLALYDKSRENVGDPNADAAAAKEETDAAAIIHEIDACQSAQSLMDIWTRCNSDRTLKPLLTRRDVTDAKDKAKARFAKPDPFTGEAA